MSTCIHLYPPQSPFWERFRLENYDFVGSDQSVHIVIVHIVVNSPPATYQLKLRHEFLLCGPPTMIAVISEYSDYSHHSDHFATSIYAYHPSYLRFVWSKIRNPLSPCKHYAIFIFAPSCEAFVACRASWCRQSSVVS